MDNKKAQEIALKRYGSIAPLISGNIDSYKSKSDYFRSVASTIGVHPHTIQRWYLRYLKEGFDGLMPKSRNDLHHYRKLDKDIKDQIIYLLSEYPRLPATMVYQKLLETNTIVSKDVSLSTVNRFVQEYKKSKGFTPLKDMKRYEREHINEVWCGDSSVGPYLKVDGKKQRTYIIALIDDASRMIVGIDIFFNDNFVNLMSVIRGAVIKYGKPKTFNFDNGSNYRSTQMNLLAARIGTVIHYNPARTPTGKAKIERWFRTMKDQWMSQLYMSDYKSLDELRKSLFMFVQEYNQRIHSSLNGKSPMERFFSESTLIIRMNEDEIERSFLLEIERKVSNDSVIVIDEKEYEVNYKYQGQRLLIRYSPNLKQVYVVDSISKDLEPIELLDKNKNSTMHRQKVKLSELGERS